MHAPIERDADWEKRRRTQIRLAQRAYRQRKETTIAGLNKRVTELENIIGKMNKTFLSFNDRAIASGIDSWEPQLAQDLKSTMESFLEYARWVERESDDGEEAETAPNRSADIVDEPSTHPVLPHESVLVSTAPPMGQDLSAEGARVAAFLGYDAASPITEKPNVPGSQTGANQNVGAGTPDISNWLDPEALRQYRVEVPNQDIGLDMLQPAFQKPPAPPLSYSYQETSFARRLLRTALEGAYRLLTNPNTRTEDIFYFCKHTFTWTNRKLCLQWLEKALKRTARESLEFWGAPQLHIGGAGLHYPRTGFDTGDSPPPGWEADSPMGPIRYMEPEISLDGSLQPACDGEWFDSNDVEQYLQTKGLFLDGHSSYVELTAEAAVDHPLEVNVPMLGSPTESSRDSNGYPPSPPTQDAILLDGPVIEDNAAFWNDDMFAMPSFDEVDGGSLWDASVFPSSKELGHFELLEPFTAPQRKGLDHAKSRKYIDVEKFIISMPPASCLPGGELTWSIAMLQSAVCLGRTPGFRRSAVDSALEAAILVRF